MANDATFYENIRHDELDRLQRAQRAREDQERQAREQEAADARAAQDVRQNKIHSYEVDINSRFDNMFTPDFYTKQENQYRDYYKPQLDKQFGKSQEDLTYWLADKGLLDSSVRGEKTGELTDLFNSGMREINNSALDFSNKTKGDVANTRASLISDARNANPVDEPTATSIMTSLAPPATSYAPPVFSSNPSNTFADMFGTFTGALGQQAAAERASHLSNGMIKPAFNTGLFAPSSDSVRNIR